jgi:hypothetical protein
LAKTTEAGSNAHGDVSSSSTGSIAGVATASLGENRARESQHAQHEQKHFILHFFSYEIAVRRWFDTVRWDAGRSH